MWAKRGTKIKPVLVTIRTDTGKLKRPSLLAPVITADFGGWA
jgi:hypothetical protein